jgi:hypothetical protein
LYEVSRIHQSDFYHNKKTTERVLQCCEHVQQITVVKEKGKKCQATVGKTLHGKLKIKQNEVKFADFLFYGVLNNLIIWRVLLYGYD